MGHGPRSPQSHNNDNLGAPFGGAVRIGAGAGRPPHSTTRRHPVPTKPSLRTETRIPKPEERTIRTESPGREPGTRPGTTSNHPITPLTRATPLHSVALRASKTISKHNLADTSLPVDNPHRRCSVWLGGVVIISRSRQSASAPSVGSGCNERKAGIRQSATCPRRRREPKCRRRVGSRRSKHSVAGCCEPTSMR